MRYFQPEEYRCRCGRGAACDAPQELDGLMAQRLDMLRESLGHPLVLTSGLRCAVWNAKVGGAPDSRHLTGQAVDLACDTDYYRFEVLQHLLNRPAPLFTFIELAPKHIHVDSRAGRAGMLMIGPG